MYTRRISIAHRAVDYFRHILSTLDPRRRAARARLQALRDACERVMAELALGCTRRFEGTVLIDGMFDNPNYWFRLSLLRAGIGLVEGTEVGLLGPFATRECRRTFANLGIGRVIRHDAYAPGRRVVFRRAQELDCYTDELRPFPHPRSAENLRALARLRGATAGVEAAEAFVVIREILA